jgi:hypothetical protein
MLAERVPGLLPELDLHDSLEVSAVHSLVGFNLADELITRPPYSDPHHSASVASIVGGGQRIARPGAISCAHMGVLFLDESTEAQSIQWRRFIPVIADVLSKLATDNLSAKFALPCGSQWRPGGQASVPSALPGGRPRWLLVGDSDG